MSHSCIFRRRHLTRYLAGLGMMLFAGAAAAHEFWIDTKTWQVAPGAPLAASIRVGQDFKGPSYSYLPLKFRRFDIVTGDRVTPVQGRAGDRPALSTNAPDPGLAVIVHVTTDTHLTYKEWDKFAAFLNHKDWTALLDTHIERGLPKTDFRERYSRYAKALIAVGDGAGADRVMGLETEIVALANPYTDTMKNGLPVRVLYQGAPRADTQVELFEKTPEGQVTVTLFRTNSDGVAHLTVQPGHVYLADAVVLRPLDAETPRDPVWESLWASLTFKVPQEALP